jgi:hypothetical protein
VILSPGLGTLISTIAIVNYYLKIILPLLFEILKTKFLRSHVRAF